MLLEKGADPNKNKKYGTTPLSTAAMSTLNSNDVTKDVIKLLIDGGAHVNERDRGAISQFGKKFC